MIHDSWYTAVQDIDKVLSQQHNEGMESILANLITIDGYLQRNPAPASNGVDDLLNRLRTAFVVYGDTKRDHIEAATSQNERECVDDLEDIFDILDELFALIWSGITCDKEKRAYSRFFKQYENSQNS